MTVPRTQTQESEVYLEQTSPVKARAWKWEKKHWLLVISAVCLLLFWQGAWMLEISWIQWLVEKLPIIGTVAFAAEKIIKLT